jgi:hypothetical protein
MKQIQTQKVTITDANDKEELTCINGYGVFTIFVEDSDHPDTGASAIFHVAANKSVSSIQRTCNAPGLDGEILTLVWGSGERPKLTFTGKPNPEFLPKDYLVLCGSLQKDDFVST